MESAKIKGRLYYKLASLWRKVKKKKKTVRAKIPEIDQSVEECNT